MTSSAIILNGGRARRMSGADKAQIKISGRSVLERQLEVLSQRFDAIAMVKQEPVDLAGHRLVSLVDRVGGLGPLDGIASGLAWSPEPWLFVMASDMPYPSLSLIDALLSARSDSSDLVGASIAGRAQPLFALYHRRLLPALEACLSERRLRASALLSNPPSGVRVTLLPEAEVLRLDPKLQSFHNLNSPKDVLTSGGQIK